MINNLLQVAILDDHPLFRMGVKLTLSDVCEVVGDAGTAAELFSLLSFHPVQLVLLDLILPDLSGVEVAARLRAQYPEVKILVLSVDIREETFAKLVEIGIDGFLSKNAPESSLLEAIRQIGEGKQFFSRSISSLERDILVSQCDQNLEKLTGREQEIMMALCEGYTTNEIAQKLFLSSRTVDNHKQHIFQKLGIHNLVQLVTYAVRNKFIVLD